jgi:alpha-glucosidase
MMYPKVATTWEGPALGCGALSVEGWVITEIPGARLKQRMLYFAAMTNLKWWQSAVFYQIYPRSFADGNGDGIGDLAGIVARLDYLRDLGIDAIWLSPHYPSSQFDCGYDVSDYTAVAPEYGSLEDFKRFLEGAHTRGLRVILDLVLNHTSHQHIWFGESRSSRTNPKRDWYIWREGRNGGPPNNWGSMFGGSAWELDPATGEYYYHFFFKEQPDLNWRNPEVKQALFDAVRFWLDLGVDGFRLDAIGSIFEDANLPDHAAELSFHELQRRGRAVHADEERQYLRDQWKALTQYQHDLPEVHTLMKELRSLVDGYPDRVLVGETEDIAYLGNGQDELQMVFNFGLTRSPRLSPESVRANQREQAARLPAGAWPCNTLGNHDSPRVWSRFGDGRHDADLARLSLGLMLTLRGTPFLYNGEEIGMTDTVLSDWSQVRDYISTWMYEAERAEGVPPAEARERALKFGRDKCRTPMQWSGDAQAGFCPAGVMPWLPMNENYADGVNVAFQDGRPGSILTFYRRLLAVRRATPALVAGSQTILETGVEILAFLRQTTDQSCLVALNYSAEAQTFEPLRRPERVIYSSAGDTAGGPGMVSLAPFECRIMELPADRGG